MHFHHAWYDILPTVGDTLGIATFENISAKLLLSCWNEGACRSIPLHLQVALTMLQAALVLTSGISASRWGYSTFSLAFNQMLQVTLSNRQRYVI